MCGDLGVRIFLSTQAPLLATSSNINLGVGGWELLCAVVHVRPPVLFQIRHPAVTLPARPGARLRGPRGTCGTCGTRWDIGDLWGLRDLRHRWGPRDLGLCDPWGDLRDPRGPRGTLRGEEERGGTCAVNRRVASNGLTMATQWPLVISQVAPTIVVIQKDS